MLILKNETYMRYAKQLANIEDSDCCSDTCKKLKATMQEQQRVIAVAHATTEILDGVDSEYKRFSGLAQKDWGFITFATALQVIRQYLITKFVERLNDQEAAKQTKGHGEEHSNRVHEYYEPTLQEIISNPVPFDALDGSNGALGGKHRYATPGHDPMLGLVVGTANIATSTITTNDFNSYHVVTNNRKRDGFGEPAVTFEVFRHTGNKLLFQGLEGKKKVAISLLKEVIHLNSDIYTKQSLPLPFITSIDIRLAEKMAEYGIDMANAVTITKQAALAEMINQIIAMVHRISYNPKTDHDLATYAVRTKKIISTSMALADLSNILYVALKTHLGDSSAIRKLDIGGFGDGLYHVLSTIKFDGEQNREYIRQNFAKIIRGEIDYSKYLGWRV